jgi:U2 small nuclear ribonucleoprotein A'
MKLTQSVIQEAPSFISPLGSRTLSLRNLHLTSLDALNTLESSDIYSTIDLAQNNLSYISDLPKLKRVTTLILSKNHIRLIDSSITNLVNIETLSLTYNDMLYLSSLEALRKLPFLRALYLIGNPIVKNENYRLWCIWRLPKLQVLDFQKVKDSERAAAEELFGKDADKVSLTLSIGNTHPSIHEEIGGSVESKADETLTEEDRERLEQELEAAESLEEIQRIEDILSRGHF